MKLLKIHSYGRGIQNPAAPGIVTSMSTLAIFFLATTALDENNAARIAHAE